ncbi:MAG: hypothetical protein KAH93_03995 [Candidatus Aenigmarchaeota archaeon]|nr:hypothetical protein [Candidatus Aenigmarchaeota archaeon]
MKREFNVWIIEPYTDIENTITGGNKINELYQFVENILGRDKTYITEDNRTGNTIIMFPLDNSRNMGNTYQLLENEFKNILKELNTNGTHDIILENEVSVVPYSDLIREGIKNIVKPEERYIPDEKEDGHTMYEWVESHILKNYKCRDFTPEDVYQDFKDSKSVKGIKPSKKCIKIYMKKMYNEGEIDLMDSDKQRYFLERD